MNPAERRGARGRSFSVVFCVAESDAGSGLLRIIFLILVVFCEFQNNFFAVDFQIFAGVFFGFLDFFREGFAGDHFFEFGECGFQIGEIG